VLLAIVPTTAGSAAWTAAVDPTGADNADLARLTIDTETARADRDSPLVSLR
jgi:hypothetical protein